MKTTLITIIVLCMIAAPVFGQADPNRTEVTQDNPVYISGGPCWEGVKFTSGSVQNSFNVIQPPNGGVQVIWIRTMKLENGVGATNGQSYSAEENFHYVFHLQKGQQYGLSQGLFFRLANDTTKKDYTVKQISVIRYDPKTGTAETVVDSYEVSCP